jgi:hypothetical protein
MTLHPTPAAPIDAPHVTDAPALTTAVVRLTVPRERIAHVMAPAILEVMGTVAAQRVGVAGAWFVRYLRMEGTLLEFEAGVPVAAPVAPAGRVTPGTLPAVRVARAEYRGAYEGLPTAWAALAAWAAAHGHVLAPGIWERYVVGPESGPDPSAWRTELNHPLVPAS